MTDREGIFLEISWTWISAQYPHGILEERMCKCHKTTLITEHKLFQSNDSKKTNF